MWSAGRRGIDLPWSVGQVNVLEFYVVAVHVPPEDLDAMIHLQAKDLNLQIDVTEAVRWNACLISMLNRVAAAGHMEQLELSIHGWRRTEPFYLEKAGLVSDALVGAILKPIQN